MRLNALGRTAFIAITFGAATVAHAAPVIFFGENLTPGGLVVGAPLTAHDAFLAAITGTGIENFESFPDAPPTPSPLALNFTGSTITAQLTGDGSVLSTPANGRFNTTTGGDSFFETASGTFAIAFNSPISAFGFYGTDMGESRQVNVALTDVNNVVTNLTVNTVHGDDFDGALLFWGFTDTSNTYQNISFSNSSPTAPVDTAGFDDMIVGVATTTTAVPEPATLALLGLGLAGLGFARRRKKA